MHFRGNWLSRALSWYLRGGVADLGQAYRRDGFVKIQQTLDQVNTNRPSDQSVAKFERIYHEVLVNNKNRFQTWTTPDGNIGYLRVNQGHRPPMIVNPDEFDWIEITSEMVKEKKLRLWHGTCSQHLKSILATGLKAGGLTGKRHYIHMSDHPPGSNLNVGGCRFDAPIGLEVDFVYLLATGVRVRKAINGAYLIRDDIPPNMII
jgi:RNA:NAD 2'-phosphotransferase (TPT1/KptA family)